MRVQRVRLCGAGERRERVARSGRRASPGAMAAPQQAPTQRAWLATMLRLRCSRGLHASSISGSGGGPVCRVCLKRHCGAGAGGAGQRVRTRQPSHVRTTCARRDERLGRTGVPSTQHKHNRARLAVRPAVAAPGSRQPPLKAHRRAVDAEPQLVHVALLDGIHGVFVRAICTARVQRGRVGGSVGQRRAGTGERWQARRQRGAGKAEQQAAACSILAPSQQPTASQPGQPTHPAPCTPQT